MSRIIISYTTAYLLARPQLKSLCKQLPILIRNWRRNPNGTAEEETTESEAEDDADDADIAVQVQTLLRDRQHDRQLSTELPLRKRSKLYNPTTTRCLAQALQYLLRPHHRHRGKPRSLHQNGNISASFAIEHSAEVNIALAMKDLVSFPVVSVAP